MRVIRWPPDTSPFFCFRSKSVDRGLSGFCACHDECLGTVDLTSHLGTIPTWLASYFLNAMKKFRLFCSL